MSEKVALSSVFNMSLGFAPILISTILCLFIAPDISLYIGAGAGFLSCIVALFNKKQRVPNPALYISTAILVVYSIVALIRPAAVQISWLPAALEITLLIPLIIFCASKKKIVNHFFHHKDKKKTHYILQSLESTVVSVRVMIILQAIHFTISAFIAVTNSPISENAYRILFRIMPSVVIIICILVNQFGLLYFNRLVGHLRYIPIVTKKGEVVGKALKSEIENYKNTFINPIIRIAVVNDGMLFLCQRDFDCILDSGKIDLPMETFPNFQETLDEAVDRLLKTHFTDTSKLNPALTVRYHFKNDTVNRLVYLYIVEVENDSMLSDDNFVCCKLWTFQQIEQNLNMDFFADCFEYEYEHLKNVIYIREKYKVS